MSSLFELSLTLGCLEVCQVLGFEGSRLVLFLFFAFAVVSDEVIVGNIAFGIAVVAIIA